MPALLQAVEARLRADGAAHGAPLDAHAVATIAAGGKRLRPLLVLLAAGPPQTRQQEDALVCAAAAVELVHSATLVHDDVLDRRRPAPRAPDGRRARRPRAGDGDRRRALRAGLRGADARPPSPKRSGCSATPARRWRAASCCSARTRGTSRSTSERYLLRCELKTARLFEAACRLGHARDRPATGGSRRASAGGSAWRSRSSTTSSTSRAPPSGPASTAGPTCSTGR